MQLCPDDPHCDFIFGVAGNQVLNRPSAPRPDQTRHSRTLRCRNAQLTGQLPPQHTRNYHEPDYQAGTRPEGNFRVILRAEIMARGDNPRFVVTSPALPSPEALYRDLYAARGQGENYIKAMKPGLSSDRTSCSGFPASHLRLYLACAAYVLHHSLRTEVLCHTGLEKAQPMTVILNMTVILKLFKLAVRVVQYQDRLKLHLPSHDPFKALMKQVTERLFLPQPVPP